MVDGVKIGVWRMSRGKKKVQESGKLLGSGKNFDHLPHEKLKRQNVK